MRVVFNVADHIHKIHWHLWQCLARKVTTNDAPQKASQCSPKPMVETNKIPRFQVFAVQSQEHPHWILLVLVFFKKTYSELNNLFQCLFLPNTQYKAMLVEWEEPNSEAEIIIRLEFSFNTHSIQQLQLYRYLYDTPLISSLTIPP